RPTGSPPIRSISTRTGRWGRDLPPIPPSLTTRIPARNPFTNCRHVHDKPPIRGWHDKCTIREWTEARSSRPPMRGNEETGVFTAGGENAGFIFRKLDGRTSEAKPPAIL